MDLHVVNFNTEKTVVIPFRGAEYTVELKMVSLRERNKIIKETGEFQAIEYYSANVKSITGDDINGREMKTLEDIYETPGADELFHAIVKEVNAWDLSEDDQKNS